jgi:hypothetical protein
MSQSRRERTLILITATVAGGVALTFAARKAIGPIQEIRAEVAAKQTERDELKNKLMLMDKPMREYAEWCARVPFDEGEALDDLTRTQMHLRDTIDEIRSDLQGSFKVTKEGEVRRTPFKPTRKTKKKDTMTVVSVDFSAEADLQAVMEFIVELYRRNELIYVSRATLAPRRPRGRTSADPDAGKNDRVQVTNLEIKSLVVPRRDEVLAEAPKPAEPGAPDPAKPQGRLAEPPVEYEVLLAWNPFEEILPDPPPVKEPPPEVERRPDKRKRNQPPESVAEDDPRDRNWIVKGFSQAVIDEVQLVRDRPQQRRRSRRNRRNQDDGPNRMYIRMGETMDGGTLEMVHRLGAVVRRKESPDAVNEDGSEASEQLWLYPYGQRLDASVLLSEASSYREVQLAVMQTADPGPAVPNNRNSLEPKNP